MISKTDIKKLSKLSTKKGRNEYNLYLIEGLRAILQSNIDCIHYDLF